MARNNGRYYSLGAVHAEFARLQSDTDYELIGWQEILYSQNADPTSGDATEIDSLSFSETDPQTAFPGYYHFALVVKNKRDGRNETKFYTARQRGSREGSQGSTRSQAVMDLEATNKMLRDSMNHLIAHNAQLASGITSLTTGIKEMVVQLKEAILENAAQRPEPIDPRMMVGAAILWQDFAKNGSISDDGMRAIGNLYMGGPSPDSRDKG